MPSNTTPNSLVYPVASDPIAPLNAVFQDLAESVQEAMLVRLEATERTTDYTLALTDAGLIVPMNKTGAATLTVPTNAAVAFPVGTIIGVFNLSSDDVTVAGDAGVTVRNAGIVEQYAEARLRKRDSNEWVLTGEVITGS